MIWVFFIKIEIQAQYTNQDSRNISLNYHFLLQKFHIDQYFISIQNSFIKSLLGFRRAWITLVHKTGNEASECFSITYQYCIHTLEILSWSIIGFFFLQNFVYLRVLLQLVEKSQMICELELKHQFRLRKLSSWLRLIKLYQDLNEKR